jgi:peptide deformylase
MSVLPIVYFPDPRLKTKSEPVAAVTDDIRTLAKNMLDTMYAEEGIGLAAVQVGEMVRLLVADVEWKKQGEIGTQYVLINPEIVTAEDEKNIHKEGCLSFPDQFAEVERPKTVRVRYMDLSGATKEEEFTGLLATCVQHEIDHLNGIVFPDRIGMVKRDVIFRKAKKIKRSIEDHAHHHHDHVHGEHCNH